MKHPTNTSLRIGRALLTALALGIAATSAALASGGPRYYVNDHLATTVGISDAAGEIAAMEADAFGSPLAGGPNASRFTGKPFDEDIGAYVFPFRNYRADEARWMSADPSGFPDGINTRLYAPNVHSELDPLGLEAQHLEVSYNHGGTASGNYKIYVSWSWDTGFKNYSDVDNQEDTGWTGNGPGPVTVNGIVYTYEVGIVNKSDRESRERTVAGVTFTEYRKFVAYELFLKRRYLDANGQTKWDDVMTRSLVPSSSGSNRTHGNWYE